MLRLGDEYADVVSSTDNAEFAKYVAGDIGSSGTVAILGGLQGFDILEARWKPLVAALKTAAPNVKVLPTQYDDFDRTKAASAASALMVAHPELKAIYAISGPEGAGAASAVKQAGKGSSVKVYTYDATPEVAQDLQNGTISAALAQSALNQGRQAAKLAIEYVRVGKTGAVQHDTSKDVQLPLKILTKDNVNSAESKDYVYASTCN